MGIFGDIFREVVSEIGSAVIEDISRELNKKDYDEERVEELRIGMDNYSLEELEEAERSTDNDIKEAATRALNFRAQFLEDIRENGLDSEFAKMLDGYDVDDFVKVYMHFMENAENFYGEDKEPLIQLLKYFMPMKGAVSRYKEIIEGHYEDTDYLELEEIVKQIIKTVDTVLLEEAYSEKRNRDEIVRVVMCNEIKEIDDDEFMAVTNLARCDSRVFHDDGTYHYRYFGYERDNVLHRCEQEMSRCRKHLLRDFIEEYCDEEFKRYYSYSKEQLQAIADWKDGEECEYENGYDYFDRLLAMLIIEIKIKEES